MPTAKGWRFVLEVDCPSGSLHDLSEIASALERTGKNIRAGRTPITGGVVNGSDHTVIGKYEWRDAVTGKVDKLL